MKNYKQQARIKHYKNKIQNIKHSIKNTLWNLELIERPEVEVKAQPELPARV